LTAAFLLGEGQLRFSTLRLGLIPISEMSCIITLHCCSPPDDRQMHDANDREYLQILYYVKFQDLPG